MVCIENVVNFVGGLYLCIIEIFIGFVREWWDMCEWVEFCEKLLLLLKINVSFDYGRFLEIFVLINLNLVNIIENLYKFIN